MLKNKTGQAVAGQNPYVLGEAGRKAWNDRYLNQASEVKNWRAAFFAAIGACIALAVSLSYIASQSHIQPYIVETSAGTPIALATPEKIAPADQRLTHFLISQFILNARTVLADQTAEKSLLLKAYAFAADDAIKFLNAHYQQNNPLEAADAVVSVKIVNAMPLSAQTWQVVWDEIRTSKTTGQSEGTTRWMADVTYCSAQVNPDAINDNPFGFYITHLVWSSSS